MRPCLQTIKHVGKNVQPKCAKV